MELMKMLIDGFARYETLNGRKPEAIYLTQKRFDELSAVLYRFVAPPADGIHRFNGAEIVIVEAP